MSWEVRHKPVCGSKEQNYIEAQAWSVKADGAFSGDLLGMIAEILVQMMQRRSKGHKLGNQDKEFLRKILSEENGNEGLAGTMAKAAAPKEKVEKDKKRRQKQRRRTEEEMDEYKANAMLRAEETLTVIRSLASNAMPKKKTEEAKARMKSIAEILHRREKERSRNKCGVDRTHDHRISGEIA